MVVEYIRYRIPEEHRPDFEVAYAQAATQLDASEHCLSYELARGVEEPENYILRIEWDSLEGHEQGFPGSEQFPPFLSAIRPYIGDIAEMKHYERTAVAS